MILRALHRYGVGDRRRFPWPHWPAPLRAFATAFWVHPLYAIFLIVLALLQALGFALGGWWWWHR